MDDLERWRGESPILAREISPHFYNTIEEVDRVMAEIASITRTKDYVAGAVSSVVT